MMNHCHCSGNQRPPKPNHTNAFLILHEVPYALGEYLDRRTFQQVDRSIIKSELRVEPTDGLRTVVHVDIDGIGRRASDGTLAVEGNNSKQRRIIQCIQNTVNQTRGQLEMLRRGIVVRVNYQIENRRTSGIIRSMQDMITIRHRQYFMDINSRDIDDNAVLVNFADSAVISAHDYVHGTDQMVLRINSIHMFYPCMRRDIKPQTGSMYFHHPGIRHPPQNPEDHYYYYHDQVQDRQCFGTPGSWGDNFGSYGHEDVGAISPPDWSGFNRFYHFDNGSRDLILHEQEIYDPRAEVFLVPCGEVQINRTFVVCPGHRVIMKFSIWKNDVVVVNDCTPIAHALGAPSMDTLCGPYPPNPYPDLPSCPTVPPNEINPDYESIVRMMNQNTHIINHQNYVINTLVNEMHYMRGMLQDVIDQLNPPISPEDPDNPDTPDTPDNPDEGGSSGGTTGGEDDKKDDTTTDPPKDETPETPSAGDDKNTPPSSTDEETAKV